MLAELQHHRQILWSDHVPCYLCWKPGHNKNMYQPVIVKYILSSTIGKYRNITIIELPSHKLASVHWHSDCYLTEKIMSSQKTYDGVVKDQL